jgi:cytochrome c oxidase subunit 2
VYVVFIAVALAMFALLLLILTRQRGSLTEKPKLDPNEGEMWIFVGGLAIPATILAVIFVVSIRVLATFPAHASEQGAAQIRITGHQWWWQVEYLGETPDQNVVTANEIHIPAGEPVDIELKSDDVIHSFWVPALHGKVDLIPGLANHLRIEANSPGVYHHAHMKITVIADAPADFNAWLAGQRRDANDPTTAIEKEGQQILLSRPCGFCHTIRGTVAGGRVGPDLTHFASRSTLAAGTLSNSDGNLEAWITHAQSIKPGAKMPNLTQFDGEQLRSITAYLDQLK